MTATLQARVQKNCHISDALHAGNYTLCIYLLKMREFYRWEMHKPFGKPMTNDEVGQWLTGREQLWDELEDNAYAALEINGRSIDPFESRQVNAEINAQGLVYSGGYGLHGKPVFFLAELEHMQILDDYTLYVSSRELARDLAAPPGMTQDRCVYIRRESLRRFIWEKFEESGWHQNETALTRALACYDFKNHAEASLEQMTDNEVDTVLHHEIGEIRAGQLLGDDWQQMIAALPRSQAEIMARAVRDNIADAVSTLPKLVESENESQIHFYFANISSMRKMLFPRLMDSYQSWLQHKNIASIKDLLRQAEDHWLTTAKSLIKLHQQYGKECTPHIEALIKSNYL
ncbi:MAG: hypothetical protein OEY43_09050 [Gammaproteobacteria bacterium]|nr:hypothetical protein [Gammaproteobacteria bacterium]